jgi:hypothetical protein
MNTIQHRWLPNQTKQLQWCDMDNWERWHTNMQNLNTRKILELNGWDKSDGITYEFNSHGFRCDEFSEVPGAVALGCSFTGGVALPQDKIWPTLVAKQLNLKLWNLGVGAASMDSCFRLLNHYITKLNVCMVLFLTPSPDRFEMFRSNNNIEWVVPNTSTFDNYQKMWYQTEQNSLQNFSKNLLAIRYLCHVNNIKLVEKNHYTDLLKVPGLDESVRSTDRGRDLEHPGVLSHKLCADLFLNAV